MAAVGEIFLGAFLQVVLDKLASCEMLNFFGREPIHTQVRNWERTLLEIQAVLDDAEEKQITNKLVNLWLEELQDLAYDLDDLLDEFYTEALRNELIEKSQSSTNKIRALSRTFMRFNPVGAIFDSKKSKHLQLSRGWLSMAIWFQAPSTLQGVAFNGNLVSRCYLS